MSYIVNALAVMCGGAAGATARFTLNDVIMGTVGPGFPYGILCINVLGSLTMGLLTGALAGKGTSFAPLRGLLMTGFLGGFTTFSTFSLDTFTLFVAGTPHLAAYNILANAVLCVAAAGVGYALIGGRMVKG